MQPRADRKRTRLNTTHTDIYPLPLHDALPIYLIPAPANGVIVWAASPIKSSPRLYQRRQRLDATESRSEEDTSEHHAHRYLPSSPTRRSSDLLDSRASERCHRVGRVADQEQPALIPAPATARCNRE